MEAEIARLKGVGPSHQRIQTLVQPPSMQPHPQQQSPIRPPSKKKPIQPSLMKTSYSGVDSRILKAIQELWRKFLELEEDVGYYL